MNEEPVNNVNTNNNNNNINDNNSNNFNNVNNANNINNVNNASIPNRTNLENPYNGISLKFILNNDSSKVYQLNAQKGDRFSDVIKKLKSENPELSEMNMKVFYFGSKVININKTIMENNLSPDTKIAIVCD